MSLRDGSAASSALVVSLTGRLVDEPEGEAPAGEVCVLHLAVPPQEGRPHPAAFPVEALIVGIRGREAAEALVADCEVRVSGRLDVAQWVSGHGRWGLQLLADDITVQAIVLNDPPVLLPEPGSR
jgi:hypothetical protein